MISETTSNILPELDLELIKKKLMHAESGESWSAARAAAVEIEYRRFLHLMKAFPDEQAGPSVDVDTFWHYHILDTAKYAADCALVFGYFLHHYPYIGLRGEGDDEVHRRSGERMRELYEQTFGESYDRAQARAAGWTAGAMHGAQTMGANDAADATPAYCARIAKAAYCARIEQSYCARITQAAYCARIEQSYCARIEQSYCARIEQSYCARIEKPAQGTIAGKLSYLEVSGNATAANQPYTAEAA
jgi:hypothetical protein